MSCPVPDSMAAAVYVGDGMIELKQVPTPVPGPGESLVEVSHCGICGTDLHLVLDRFASSGDILGHEWSGTVVKSNAVASEAVPRLAPGTRVVGNPTPGCGRCRACRNGRPAVCFERPPPDFLNWRGAFRRYMTVSTDRLTVIPDELSIREAALTEPTAIAIHAVNLSGVRPEDRVLVTGAGPIGLLTVAVLATRGIEDITVSDPSELRRSQALGAGAKAVVDPADLQPAPMGRPVQSAFAVSFECSGRAAACESAMDQLDYAGTMVLVGTGGELPTINHNRMIILEQTMVGAYNYDRDGFESALALLASGNMPLDLLIDDADVPLEGVLGAIERLARCEIASKVLVNPRK